MSKSGIDVAKLGIDELGRTVLPDDVLDRVQASDAILSAGANLGCEGSTNGSCSNGSCGNSSNSTSCANTIVCVGSSNIRYCTDGPIG